MKIIPLITHFNASGMTHGEARMVANSYGWKAYQIQLEGDEVIARRISEKTIERRRQEYGL